MLAAMVSKIIDNKRFQSQSNNFLMSEASLF